MDVLALTILISSSLAGIFIACFAMELRRNRYGSSERDSLLPLDSPTSSPSKGPSHPPIPSKKTK